MKVYTLRFNQVFSSPAEVVFSHLGDHVRYGEITGAKIIRVKEGTDTLYPNGVGSVRRICIPLLPFEETVTSYEWGKRIEYKITKGSPLHHHFGKMDFIYESPYTSRLDYTIELGSAFPGVGWIVSQALKWIMQRSLQRFSISLRN